LQSERFQVSGLCEYGIETSGFIKDRTFLEEYDLLGYLADRLAAGILLGLLFDDEDGNYVFLRNVRLSPNYRAYSS
jgi:hypothetical protein